MESNIESKILLVKLFFERIVKMIYILQMTMQTFFFFQLFSKENKSEGRSELLLGPDDNIEIWK